MDFTKPRIAIYYYVLPSTGMRNDGPPLFLQGALRRLLNGKQDFGDQTGNVVHLWPTNRPEDYGTFDLHIWPDHGEDALSVPTDWVPPHPNAYWCSDAHLGYDYRLSMAKKFDYVFCCQKRAMAEFERDGVLKEKLFFLPHAVEPTAYAPYSIIEKWDWAFIGHLNCPERVDLLHRFCEEFPNFYLGWRNGQVAGWNVLEDAARKLCQAKIIPNRTISDDISMRFFETMACKRLFLTNEIPMEGLFENGKHLVTYRTVDEAVESARRLLLDHAKREAIAKAGYEEVMAHHTYDHRAKEILRVCLDYSVKENSYERLEKASGAVVC
jgi:O-antigen biosynthesis protein